MIVRKSQNNFTTGIISEGVSRRTDLQKYSAACLDLVNAIVRPQGGVSKRPGLEHIATLTGDGLLIPFQYSETQSSVLYFTNYKVFVYTGGVLDGVPSTGLDSPYSLSDLPKLRFTQSADVLFLTHHSYAVRKLKREVVNNVASWSFEVMEFKNSNRFQVSDMTLANITGSTDGVKYLKTPIPLGTYEIGAYGALSEFDLYSKYSGTGYTVVLYTVSVVLEDGSESMPKLAVAGKAAKLWEQGQKIAVRWLPPVGDITMSGFTESYRNAAWSYLDGEYSLPDSTVNDKFKRYKTLQKIAGVKCFDADGRTYVYEGAVATGETSNYAWKSGSMYAYTTTDAPAANGKCYSDAECTEDETTIKAVYSDEYRIGYAWEWSYTGVSSSMVQEDTYNGTVVSGKNISALPVSLSGEFPTVKHGYMNYYQYYVQPAAGTNRVFERDGSTNISWLKVDDEISGTDAVVSSIEDYSSVKRYYVYKNSVGSFGYVGTVEEPGITSDNVTEYREFQDDCISPDYSQSLKCEEDPFGSEDSTTVAPVGTNPSVCGIFQQRLVLAGTDDSPQTIWMSEPGVFYSFGTHSPLVASDAIEATLDSRKMNPIKHFVQLKDAMVLTSGAEYLINSGTQADAISPTSIKVSPQSYWGCSDIPPISIGTYALFIQNSGVSIRDLSYKYAEDSFIGDSMTILADDIITSACVDWSYQQDPNSCIWLCLSDGSLLSFTYFREQEVYAWARHESSGGQFRSCCTIRESGKDRTYFLVKRGTNSYQLERLALYEFSYGAEDCVFLDQAKSVSAAGGTATLPYLAGRTDICIRAGKTFYTNITASASGVITLPSTTESTVLIGVPYGMLVQTVDPEITIEGGGSVVDDKRSVAEIVVSVRKTAPGLKVGSGSSLETAKMPYQEAYGASVKLFTGHVPVTVAGYFKDSASVTITHDTPLPCTVLSVLTKVAIR